MLEVTSFMKHPDEDKGDFDRDMQRMAEICGYRKVALPVKMYFDAGDTITAELTNGECEEHVAPSNGCMESVYIPAGTKLVNLIVKPAPKPAGVCSN